MAELKWTNDLLLLLIETYRNLECLWNPKDQKYKCRNTKHDAWSTLCHVTGANEVEVKRKVRNLVSQFFRERKRYGSYKKSGAGAVFVSKWFAYNNMLFLADKNKVHRCTEEGLNANTETFSSASEHDSETEGPDSPMSQYPHTSTLNSSQQDQETQNILVNQTPRTGNKRSAQESSTSEGTHPGTSTQQLSEPRPSTIPSTQQLPQPRPSTIPWTQQLCEPRPSTVPSTQQLPQPRPSTIPWTQQLCEPRPSTVPSTQQLPQPTPSTVPSTQQLPQPRLSTIPWTQQLPEPRPSTIPSTQQLVEPRPSTIPSTQQLSKPRPSPIQLSETGTSEQHLPTRSKTTKRKRNAKCIDERQEEAYKVLKELQYQKPRSKFQAFGDHVALKIESLKSEYAQNAVEHLISNILWEASIGKYDGRPPFTVHNPYPSGSSTSVVQFQSTPIPQLLPEPHNQYEIPFIHDMVSSRSNSHNEMPIIPDELSHQSLSDYVAPNNTSYSSSNLSTVTEDNTSEENNADTNLAPPRGDTFSIIHEAILNAGMNI